MSTLLRSFIFAGVLPLILCPQQASADQCQYRSFNGTVSLTGVDGWTFTNTPIWAILHFAGGVASEMYVENHDPANAIYFSGVATGSNQYNAASGRTGEQVTPGGALHFPLSIYQSREAPVTSNRCHMGVLRRSHCREIVDPKGKSQRYGPEFRHGASERNKDRRYRHRRASPSGGR